MQSSGWLSGSDSPTTHSGSDCDFAKLKARVPTENSLTFSDLWPELLMRLLACSSNKAYHLLAKEKEKNCR